MRYSIEEVIRANKAAGYHFFDRDTMEFFGCKIVSPVFENCCFVTEEDDFLRTQRLYTVRQFDPLTGSVETVGEFQEYGTIEEAIRAALEVRNV